MNVKFGNKELAVRSVETFPSRLKIDDLLIGPSGMLLKVLTVQPGCPIWESNRATICAVLVETESHTMIPLRNLSGKIKAYRPIKAH